MVYGGRELLVGGRRAGRGRPRVGLVVVGRPTSVVVECGRGQLLGCLGGGGRGRELAELGGMVSAEPILQLRPPERARSRVRIQAGQRPGRGVVDELHGSEQIHGRRRRRDGVGVAAGDGQSGAGLGRHRVCGAAISSARAGQGRQIEAVEAI